MCICVNCDCEECGLQNPERLEGEAAKAAGVSCWTKEWNCDVNCSCCNK